MIFLRLGRYASSACAATAIFAGCGGSSGTPTPANCNNQAPPFVQLLYPIPGSKNVHRNVGVLILAENEHQLPWLRANGNFRSYGKLMPLPSPLPQPELTPAPGASLCAASVRSLAQSTKYGGVGIFIHHVLRWRHRVPEETRIVHRAIKVADSQAPASSVFYRQTLGFMGRRGQKGKAVPEEAYKKPGCLAELSVAPST